MVHQLLDDTIKPIDNVLSSRDGLMTF